MARDCFPPNAWPSLGVEIELQLVDAWSMALKSAITEIRAGLADELKPSVKPEFMQCYLEIESSVCRTVAELEADLASKIRGVEAVAEQHDVQLFWAATHPFSSWRDQRITPNARYYKLADLLQETVVRPVTFGLHIHVGVDSGDKAIQVGDRLLRHLPALLALSANSPFWNGRSTGHHAHRIELLEGFPTGGLPPRLRDWADYQALVDRMIAARFIESAKEIWWDVRPNAAHGTVEVRVCDMPPDLPGVLGLSALIQCLVHTLSKEIDAGRQEPEIPPLMVRQNRWLACRYGLGASLVDPITLEVQPARRAVEVLVERVRGAASDLESAPLLERVLEMTAGASGAERQLDFYQECGDLAEVVRRMVARSALSPPRARPGSSPWRGTDSPHGPAALPPTLMLADTVGSAHVGNGKPIPGASLTRRPDPRRP